MKDKILKAVLLLAAVLVVVPMMYYCMLSVPFADDFSNARITREYLTQYGDYFKAAVFEVRDDWLSFQGTYTGDFFIIFLNAYARWGLVGMRVFNTIVTMLFFLTMLYVVYAFCRNNDNPRLLSLWIFVVTLFWITNNQMYDEIWTWSTGVYIYTIPCIFLLLGVANHLGYIMNRKHEWIVATIFAALMGGSPINLATLGCGLHLIIVFYAIYQKNIKKDVRVLVPFIAAVVGTLINTLAPGNYTRWGSEGDVSLIRVAVISFLNVLLRLWQLSTKTFLVLMIVLFIVVFKYAKLELGNRLTYKHPALLGVLFIFGCALVNFSYCLGGKHQTFRNWRKFESRALFVEDLTIYILAIIWIFYFVGYIRQRYPGWSPNRSHTAFATAFGLAFIAMICGTGSYDDLTTPYMIRTIADGSIKNFADYQENIIDKIRECDGEIIIRYDHEHYDRTTPLITGLDLSDDPERWDYWHNVSIANYYGKSRVDVEYYYED